MLHLFLQFIICKKYLVGLYEDSKGRVSATMKIYKFLMPSNDIKKGDIVNATVYRINDEIGTFVAVEDRYFGLIPKSECFEEYSVGDELTLRVTRVREDKKLSRRHGWLLRILIDVVPALV